MNDLKERIETAVDLMKSNESFSVGNLRLGIRDGYIYITGWSEYIYIESITKSIAMSELAEIKRAYFEMVDISDSLKKFSEGKDIEFVLAFDYGKGGFLICSEKNGIVKWGTSFAGRG